MAPVVQQLWWLILTLFDSYLVTFVGLLAFNVYLIRKVYDISRQRVTFRDINTGQPVSPSLWQTQPQQPSSDGTAQANSKQQDETVLAECLIGLSIWAFNNRARNAKWLTLFVAAFSLATTWYYMIHYLVSHYNDYIERALLVGYSLPKPPPLDLSKPNLILFSLNLTARRISHWLSSTSLFFAAWSEVVRGRFAWWWSSEICIFTAVWALSLRHQAATLQIPQIWAFMLLGQLCSVSFAFNLFNLAILCRLQPQDLFSRPSPEVYPQRLILKAETRQTSLPPIDPAHLQGWMPPPSSRVSGSLPNQATCPPFQKIYVGRKKSSLEQIYQVVSKLVSDTLFVQILVFAGVVVVYQHPETIETLAIMHLIPFLVVVYPLHRSLQPTNPATDSSRHDSRRHERRRGFRYWKCDSLPDLKLMYVFLAMASFAQRMYVSYDCFRNPESQPQAQTQQQAQTQGGGLLERMFDTVTALFPTTFYRHPAMSSMGCDHIAVSVSVVVFILLESGLWLWKLAKSSPSAVASWFDGQLSSVEPNRARALYLDFIDRARVEQQARIVFGLVLLTPILGGSTTYALYLALRMAWEQDSQSLQSPRSQVNDELPSNALSPPGRTGEDYESRLIQDSNGDRFLLIRPTNPTDAAGLTGAFKAKKGDKSSRHAIQQLLQTIDGEDDGDERTEEIAMREPRSSLASSSSSKVGTTSSRKRK